MVPAKAWVRAHAHITRRTSVECVDSTGVNSTFRLGGELDGRMVKLSVEAYFGWRTLHGRTTKFPGVATTADQLVDQAEKEHSLRHTIIM